MKKILFFIIGITFLFLVNHKAVSAAEVAISGSSAITAFDSAEVEKRKDFDLKVKKIKYFLKKYDSPVEENSKTFVEMAQKYNLDWRMVVAILGVESTFGKRIPENSFNGWGWGIPTGSLSGIGFKNWDHGIEEVSKGLREKYLNRGLDDVYKIGPVYAPPSRTWSGNVNSFMEKLENVSVPPEFSI